MSYKNKQNSSQPIIVQKIVATDLTTSLHVLSFGKLLCGEYQIRRISTKHHTAD